MKIAVGSDHAGFEEPKPYYKPAVIAHLQAAGHEIIDCGTEGPDSVDYPDYAARVAKEILEGRADRGVLICGTGMGICMAANRFKGIRAAPCTTEDMTVLARTHNNANIICFGRRITDLDTVLKLVDIFLATEFSHGERHERRIQKMG